MRETVTDQMMVHGDGDLAMSTAAIPPVQWPPRGFPAIFRAVSDAGSTRAHGEVGMRAGTPCI